MREASSSRLKKRLDQTLCFRQTFNLCALAKRVENSSKFRSFVRWVLHTQKSWQKKPWVKCFQTQVTSVAEIVQLSTQSPPVHCKYIGCRNYIYMLCLNYPTILKSTLQIIHWFMVLAKMFSYPSHVSCRNCTIIHTISLPIGRQNTLQTSSLQFCTK